MNDFKPDILDRGELPPVGANPAAPGMPVNPNPISTPVVGSMPPGLQTPYMQQPQFVPPRPKSKMGLAVGLIIGLVLLVLAGATVYLWLTKKQVPAQHTGTNQNGTAHSTVDVKNDPLLAKFVTPSTGETWLSKPKQVSNLGYYNDTDDGKYITYYQVGMHGQNIIYLSDPGVAGGFKMLYEKAPDGSAQAILHPDANERYTTEADAAAAQVLAAGVTANTTTHYDSLSVPGTLSVGHGETVYPDYGGTLHLGSIIQAPTSGITRTTVQTYGSSKLVRVARKYADTKLTAINYAIDLPIGTEVNLYYQPINPDLVEYTWDNDATVSSSSTSDDYTISGIIRGCGSADTAVSRADGVKDADFTVVGKTDTGKNIYTFADNANQIMQKSYGEYADYYKDVAGATVVSFDDFVKNHAVLAYKNGAGEWLVYTRNNYAAVGGCAKPVVYLYPTHAQQVTVRIGAAVTVSDPQYSPTQGWTALAQPNGQLTVGDKVYSSLFWEGQGQGLYPAITSGTVVRRIDAAATIRTQLKQQGLTAQETSDFMDYWTSRIPNKPYVRLTWFNTAQLNELAPLQVQPRPDTVIRVFLDMSGLDKSIKLPAQQLTAIPRTGFTLVEWGGLSQGVLK
jgi:hypothetical protein